MEERTIRGHDRRRNEVKIDKFRLECAIGEFETRRDQIARMRLSPLNELLEKNDNLEKLVIELKKALRL
jgi:hypothetical protein